MRRLQPSTAVTLSPGDRSRTMPASRSWVGDSTCRMVRRVVPVPVCHSSKPRRYLAVGSAFQPLLSVTTEPLTLCTVAEVLAAALLALHCCPYSTCGQPY